MFETFKGTGNYTGNMYYQVKVYSENNKINDITQSFFNELEKKYTEVVSKNKNENLTFDNKTKSIRLQRGSWSFYSLLCTIYQDKVKAIRGNEYVIEE